MRGVTIHRLFVERKRGERRTRGGKKKNKLDKTTKANVGHTRAWGRRKKEIEEKENAVG